MFPATLGKIRAKRLQVARRTSVKEREEVEESQNGHQPKIYFPPCPRFFLGCERGWSERVNRIGIAFRAVLDVRHRWFVLLRSHGEEETEEEGRERGERDEESQREIRTVGAL